MVIVTCETQKSWNVFHWPTASIFSWEIILFRLRILMPSVRKQYISPQQQQQKESCGQGHMGNAGWYFVNQVSLLLRLLEMLTVNVLCEVSDVFDCKILLVSEGLRRLLSHGLCFEENYSLPVPRDHYWANILPLEKVIWTHCHHWNPIHLHQWVLLIPSLPLSLAREPTYWRRSQHISGS